MGEWFGETFDALKRYSSFEMRDLMNAMFIAVCLVLLKLFLDFFILKVSSICRERVCVCVCVCVCVRERERERVCVCVCEKERERVCVCVTKLKWQA